MVDGLGNPSYSEPRPLIRKDAQKDRQMIANRYCAALLAGCLLLLVGCGGDRRQPLEGTVTLDGQPLGEGSISFVPLPGTAGPTAGANIAAGRFSIAADQGTFTGHVPRRDHRQAEDRPAGPQRHGRRHGRAVRAVPAPRATTAKANSPPSVKQGSNRFEFRLTSQ